MPARDEFEVFILIVISFGWFCHVLTPASPILGIFFEPLKTSNPSDTKTQASKNLKPYTIQKHGPLKTSNPSDTKTPASKNLKYKQKQGL